MADDSFLTDLRLTRRSFDQQVSNRQEVDLTVTAGGDVGLVSGRENLAQAMVNRLFTRQGELSRLGHAGYGSRLHLLVGELNNARTRGLAEIYVRECLAQERRIEKVTRVKTEPPSRGVDRDTLYITVTVKPVNGSRPLTLTIPVRG
ncbi:MAG: GPW/gp25 family protein [Acidobacteriia bacterium]|nr:GPW/gp25 family protein [Terriglobia bacterium]